jgi:hypothetical protein
VTTRTFAGVITFAVLVGCGSDPAPQTATSVTDKPTAPAPQTATTAAAATGTAASPSASASAAAAPAAGDPAALLGGGAALEALPTRATAPGKPFDPRLRQTLMEVPSL